MKQLPETLDFIGNKNFDRIDRIDRIKQSGKTILLILPEFFRRYPVKKRYFR